MNKQRVISAITVLLFTKLKINHLNSKYVCLALILQFKQHNCYVITVNEFTTELYYV